MADLNIVNNPDVKQYIGILLGNERFGIDINYVDNIVRLQRITRVPKAQDYFLGVINLRGEIIPVMSLRRKFGLEPDQLGPKTRILILKPEAQATVGFIVDEVHEVLNISDSEVDHIGNADEKTTYIYGVGKQGSGLVSILNVNAVLVDTKDGMAN